MAATCAALGLVPFEVVEVALVGVVAGEVEVLVAVAVLELATGVDVAVALLEFATGVLVALEVLEFAAGVTVLPPVLALVLRAVVLADDADELDFPLLRVSCGLQAASGMASAKTMIVTSIGPLLIRDLVQGQTLARTFFSLIIIAGSLVERMLFSVMFDCNFLAAQWRRTISSRPLPDSAG